MFVEGYTQYPEKMRGNKPLFIIQNFNDEVYVDMSKNAVNALITEVVERNGNFLSIFSKRR